MDVFLRFPYNKYKLIWEQWKLLVVVCFTAAEMISCPVPELRSELKQPPDEITNKKCLQLFSAPVERQTEGNTPGRSSQLGGHVGNDQEVEEDWVELAAEETKDRGVHRSTTPELELVSNPQIADTSMDCPICQGSFPLTEIEIHAAYCDGDVVVTNRTQPKHDSYQGDANFNHSIYSTVQHIYDCIPKPGLLSYGY